MHTSRLFQAVVFIAIGMAIGGMIALTPLIAQEPVERAIPRWEYMTISVSGEHPADRNRDDFARFNDLGDEGWEFVGAVEGSKSSVMVFKRPKPT